MRGGIIVVVIGLFLAYLGVAGKFCCLTQLLTCFTASGQTGCCACGVGKEQAQATAGATTNFADLLRPLEVPGVQTAPYNFNLFG